MSKASAKSLPAIAIMRSLSIILIVLGHSDIANQTTPAWYFSFEKIIYTFHVPTFLFLSGFLLIYTNTAKFNFIKFYKSKLYRLLVPSIILLVVAYVIRAFLSNFKETAGGFSVSNFVLSFFYHGLLPIEFYWFVFSLLGMFLFSGYFIYVVKNRKYLLVILTTVLLLYLNLKPVKIELLYILDITKFFIFFWLGCAANLVFAEARKLNVTKLKSVGFALLCVAGLLTINLLVKNTNEPVRFLSGLVGIAACFFTAHLLTYYNFGLIELIGRYSYQIFLLSWFFHRIVETVGFKFLNLPFYITFPLSFLLVVGGSIVISRLIEKKLPAIKFAVGM